MAATVALALKYIAPQALNFAKKELDAYIKNQVDRQIVEAVLERTYARMDRFIAALVRRTHVYMVLSLIGLAPLLAGRFWEIPKWVHLLLFVVTSSTVIYMFVQMVLNLKRVSQYLIRFEDQIRFEIESEFAKLKAEDWKKRLAMWYSGVDAKNYLHLVLAHIVIGFCNWFRSNIRHLYWRLLSFFLASFSVGSTAEILLDSWLG